MKSIRLLPVVLVAITALFLLKGIGLVTQGGYLLVGTSQAQAQAQFVPEPGAMELSAAEIEAAARAAEALFADDEDSEPVAPEPVETEPETQAEDSADVGETNTPAEETATGEEGAEEEEALADEALSPTELAVLRRLRERRAQLDRREQELELRMALVEAAEARLSERIASLEQLEAQVQALVEQKNAQGDAQFSSLVSMYENMKSTDAAAVFNTLNMEVLLRLAINMNPRKMSPIMADMQTDRAQELTVRMATARTEPDQMQIAANEVQNNSDLPQIVGQ